ncbi:MAG: sulfide/dihydroorotate dehydrogenase-like FAD/NAD-binding protein [Coriobacteriaceae bacterium]|nr:sulfide/dihydroorotate dehydrogenase-like FAD/NAD-binding protein [Coriobacteriaceae bacterium]
MFTIIRKKALNNDVTLMEIEAPDISRKAKPGQFIIYRIDEQGERIPLTIADTNPETGTVTIIFQQVGASTKMLAALSEGDSILDFVGPLGSPSHLEGIERACIIGGGVGCAIAYPQAKELHRRGAAVDVIVGFRSKELVILEDEFREVCDNFYITTDDGSYGEKGFVTDRLKALLDAGNVYDEVIAIGPVPMMKFVSKLTKEYDVKTTVSLNPIMIDGTGMCGGCRVTVGGEVKFACVDGPEFDGHQVDFDELMHRNSFYQEQERGHACRLTGGMANG